jgi:hypothetical protein
MLGCVRLFISSQAGETAGPTKRINKLLLLVSAFSSDTFDSPPELALAKAFCKK